MVKRVLFVTVLLFTLLISGHAQDIKERKITATLNETTIEAALDYLSQKESIHISFQSNLPGLHKTIVLQVADKPLEQLMETIFRNSGLSFKIYANQVVVFPIRPTVEKNTITARICISETELPIPYAGIELLAKHKGTIANADGKFLFDIDSRDLADTLRISSLNYEPILFPVSALAGNSQHTIFLIPRVFKLPEIKVNGPKFEALEAGNRAWLKRGSQYVDTHGQQTALYIANETHSPGFINSVSYFLTQAGNVNTPFRIHVYLADSATGKPGSDLIPEVVVVKPGANGWYSVDIKRYRIPLPRNGVFVAIEGVFPDDYTAYYNGKGFQSDNGAGESSEGFTESALLYGQCVGYSRGSVNNTWHYAIDRTWFQLKKGHVNAMMSAEFQIVKKNKKWKIFNLFRKYEKDTIH